MSPSDEMVINMTDEKKVPELTLITPDNTTTLTDYVNTYPTTSLNSNHWVGSCQIGQVVDDNLKVLNTDNLVRQYWCPILRF